MWEQVGAVSAKGIPEVLILVCVEVSVGEKHGVDYYED